MEVVVKCDKCGYEVPIPSRDGAPCNMHDGNDVTGYCQGTLHLPGWFAEQAEAEALAVAIAVAAAQQAKTYPESKKEKPVKQK